VTLSFCELFSRRDEKDSTSCEVLAHWRGHTPWGVKCWLGGFTLGLKSGAPGPIPCSGTVLCFTIIGFGSQCRIKEALPYRVTFYMWCMAASRKTPQDATLNQTKIQLASFCIPLTPIRVPAYSRHRSGYLHTPETGQGTCILQTPVRVPAYPRHQSGYLHTPDTGQGTCIPQTPVRVPAYSRHRSGYLHTPDTGQGSCIL